MKTITESDLHQFANCKTVNMAQAKILEVDWPLSKGWFESVNGKQLSDDDFALLCRIKGCRGGENRDEYNIVLGMPTSGEWEEKQKKWKESKRAARRQRRERKRKKKVNEQPVSKKRKAKKDQYSDYLKSPLWRRIKELVWIEKGSNCWICGGGASVIHHQSYDEKTMNGDDREKLYPLCDRCHASVHFDDVRGKLPLREAFAKFESLQCKSEWDELSDEETVNRLTKLILSARQ